MTRMHWFLPQVPDVVGMLRQQSAITVEGMDALVAWAGGEAAAPDRMRKSEHEADDRKRELRKALTEAFSTPLEPEDIFELSRGLDEILDSARTSSARPKRWRPSRMPRPLRWLGSWPTAPGGSRRPSR